MVAFRGDMQRKTEAKQTHSPAFFFGTEKGLVAYADDLGHCTDVQQLSSTIDVMLFFEEKSRLIIITRSLLLTQYQVAEDGKVTRVTQMKLSVAGDLAERGLKFVVWAGPGLIAAATNEKMVLINECIILFFFFLMFFFFFLSFIWLFCFLQLRLLDLASDETYNLSLTSLGDIVDRSDRIISVAFSPLDRF